MVILLVRVGIKTEVTILRVIDKLQVILEKAFLSSFLPTFQSAIYVPLQF